MLSLKYLHILHGHPQSCNKAESTSVKVIGLLWRGQAARHTILWLHDPSHHQNVKHECFQIKLFSLCFKEDSDRIQIHCTLWRKELAMWGQEHNLAKSKSKHLFFSLFSVFLCSYIYLHFKTSVNTLSPSGNLTGIYKHTRYVILTISPRNPGENKKLYQQRCQSK